MKKSFTIMLLAALQCACTTQPVAYQPQNSLISFAEISSEISVGYEVLEEETTEADVVAMSLTDSP